MGAIFACPRPGLAAPSIWDQDDNRIDDRIETVHLNGYSFSFENQDTTLRQRIEVGSGPAGLLFGAYVVFQQSPSDSDIQGLTLLGMRVTYRYDNLPAVRTLATFAQAQAAAALPGVERVEAIPMIYPVVRDGLAAIGARDPTDEVFPTWAGVGGALGHGIVVAILDTGVNDTPDGAYPGHESLLGKCLGGGYLAYGDSSLDTPKSGSANPIDHGGPATQSHGTHMAGVILGSGGSSGYAVGVAPEARFVDVKVLDDTGTGTAVPEGLDWCISNRARDWGSPDPDYQGIDVINLSLSSIDRTDGNDVASRLANRAVELGMVVVASMGNEGRNAYVPSPAGGDRVLAVDAYDDQRTPRSSDDAYAGFNDLGPRASDGDLDQADEQKPDLLAPGVAVLSPDGDLSSDGNRYQRLTGTSLAAAFVSGAVAALRSAYPGLDPAQIAELLRATAHRYLNAGAPVGGPDPRWNARIGFGAIDLYAALLEVEHPERSQVRRLLLTASDGAVTAAIWTQRERGAAHFVFERAPDMAGVPGDFAAIDSAAAAGDPSLADLVNLTAYLRSWPVAAGELGQSFWYRASFTEGGVRYDSPARRVTIPAGPSVATIELVVVHNAYDNDVTGDVRVHDGGGTAMMSFPLPGTNSAVASDWVDGTSATGNIEWRFRIPVPAGAAEMYLPPSPQHPWQLRLTEGGYLNRSGRVTGLRLIVPNGNGDTIYEGAPLPQQTVEGGTTSVWIPSSVVSAEPGRSLLGLRLAPNPALSGGQVSFEFRGEPSGELEVFDLLGRRLATARLRGVAGLYSVSWAARDRRGQPLPAGVYFARVGRAPAVRVVILAR